MNTEITVSIVLGAVLIALIVCGAKFLVAALPERVGVTSIENCTEAAGDPWLAIYTGKRVVVAHSSAVVVHLDAATGEPVGVRYPGGAVEYGIERILLFDSYEDAVNHSGVPE